MADQKKKDAPLDPHTDSMLNLKFAEAEADLSTRNGGLGPTSNEYVSTDEDQEISDAEGPRDRQGQRRGETDPTDEGSTAGSTFLVRLASCLMHHLHPTLPGREPLAGRWLLRLLVLLAALALLGGCRASGPATPARTVDAFFSKYGGRPGFRTNDWSVGVFDRLKLAGLGRVLSNTGLLSGSAADLSNAITGIRSARALTFVPTSSAARDLAREGLLGEATGVLQAERYTPLATASGSGPATFNYAVRATGDQVTELVATGSVPNSADSFVMAQVKGSFTRAQAEALARVLPDVVRQTSGQ